MSCVYAGTQRKQNTMKGTCIYGAVIRRGKKKKRRSECVGCVVVVKQCHWGCSFFFCVFSISQSIFFFLFFFSFI